MTSLGISECGEKHCAWVVYVFCRSYCFYIVCFRLTLGVNTLQILYITRNISGVVNMHGFVWKFFYAPYIHFIPLTWWKASVTRNIWDWHSEKHCLNIVCVVSFGVVVCEQSLILRYVHCEIHVCTCKSITVFQNSAKMYYFDQCFWVSILKAQNPSSGTECLDSFNGWLCFVCLFSFFIC